MPGKHLSVLAAVVGMTVALAGRAEAAKGGVVFVHGTADWSGTQSCTGTGDSFKCVVSAAITGYWSQSFIDSVRKRNPSTTSRPYAVVGCAMATTRPWVNGAESGTADCTAVQIERFIKGPDNIYGNTDDITDLVIVTHSGGSNVMRYLLQQYTGTTARSRVRTATRKVVAVAPPHKGTYLADVAIGTGIGQFANGVIEMLGNGSYNDDGTKLLRITEMPSHNADASKFVNLSNPVAGITFRNAGGTYPDAAIWASKTWAGGYGYAVGLNLLHRLYLNGEDSSKDLSSCSDGFIPCKSMVALGGASSMVFGSTNGYASSTVGSPRYRNHHQTRRDVNGVDTDLRAEVNSTAMAYFDTGVDAAADKAPVATWDACQFSVNQPIVGSGGWYTAGCAPSRLGNGKCDWDCFSVYGRDAVPTWSAGPGSTVTAWGADDCAVIDTRSPYSATYTGQMDTDTWQEVSKTYWTSTCDPAWLNDGECDQCWVALAGADGNDCRPGRMSACYGWEIDVSSLSSLDSNSTWAYIKKGGWTLNASPAHGNGYCEWDECTTYPSDCANLCN